MNPYVDPATGTPHNKLGITDGAELRRVEYLTTNLRIAEYLTNPTAGLYDLAHLKVIHHHIFQDVYEWAGKERTLNMTKRSDSEPNWISRFAEVEKIPAIVESVSTDLKQWNYLRDQPQTTVASSIAAVYVKLNFMHAYPDGNGRTTQTLLTQLAREAGYDLNFSKIGKDEWNRAASRTVPQFNLKEPLFIRQPDIKPIVAAFTKVIEPLRERDKSIAIER